jgi:hypothetical protein
VCAFVRGGRFIPDCGSNQCAWGGFHTGLRIQPVCVGGFSYRTADPTSVCVGEVSYRTADPTRAAQCTATIILFGVKPPGDEACATIAFGTSALTPPPSGVLPKLIGVPPAMLIGVPSIPTGIGVPPLMLASALPRWVASCIASRFPRGGTAMEPWQRKCELVMHRTGALEAAASAARRMSSSAAS